METTVLYARPAPDECAAYYYGYIELVPQTHDILDLLARNIDETATVLREIGEARSLSRYAPGKWSIKEVIGHLIDCERIFGYRALRIARGDKTPMPGFEQDDYIAAAQFDGIPLEDLIAGLIAQRHANLLLFESLLEEETRRSGTASDCPFTVRTIPYILAGHELHHRRVIEERYMS